MKNPQSLWAVLLAWAILFGGAAMAQAGTVTGTVTYLERMAVPPGAVLDVRLVDVSRMDVAATTISSMHHAIDRVPFPFSLAYDDALIDDRMTYAVQASILVAGKAMYRSTESHQVLTRGAPKNIDIVVQRMAPTEPAPGLDNTAWVVTDIKGRVIIADKLPTIEFAEGGKFGADSTCNRVAGTAEIDGTRISFPKAMAMTRMACAEPYEKLQRDFVDALGEVAGFELNGDRLALVNAAGVTVLQLAAKG